MHTSGTLYIISAPSGAGKSSLIQALLAQFPDNSIKISISHTTRSIRQSEEDAKHYYFINHDEFLKMINQGLFLEYAQVYDHYYGTSRQMIMQHLQCGIDIILDIDWQGCRQIKQQLPDAKSIFILPPSLKLLEERLIHRAQDCQEVIDKRMKKAVSEIKHYVEYDYLIINDNFTLALQDLNVIIKAERLKKDKQQQKYTTLIANLLKA